MDPNSPAPGTYNFWSASSFAATANNNGHLEPHSTSPAMHGMTFRHHSHSPMPMTMPLSMPLPMAMPIPQYAFQPQFAMDIPSPSGSFGFDLGNEMRRVSEPIPSPSHSGFGMGIQQPFPQQQQQQQQQPLPQPQPLRAISGHDIPPQQNTSGAGGQNRGRGRGRGGKAGTAPKRKRPSFPENSSNSASAASASAASSGKSRSGSNSATKFGGALVASPVHEDLDELLEHDQGLEQGQESGSPGRGKKKPTRNGYPPGLISCEACRRGKRRCEPSPLVPPDHPEAAKLPCARCRRFATECVRVRTVKRKGPAKVDLSAVSDAAHGFNAPSSPSTAALDLVQQNQDGRQRMSSGSTQVKSRKSSSTSSHFISPVLTSALTPQENLDQIIPKPTLDKILTLFFNYVYPLTPCLHRPTFMADLAARRDLKDPVFFALVLSVVVSTLVQVPRILVGMEKEEVETLATRCLGLAREKLDFLWETSTAPQSAMVVISYLLGIGYLILGNNTAHVITTAQANQLALALRLNEESSYEGLDPIEDQIRRRIYWLLFQADKSTACMRARTINLRLDDANDLRLPAEVDDEQIRATGILPQPPGQTPLIAGFNVATNLFKTLNEALLIQRKKIPETLEGMMVDLQLLNILQERTIRACNDVAEPLRLHTVYNSRAVSPAIDWQAKLHERFVDYFETGATNQQPTSGFAVMQGNIIVTQHVVRMVIIQVRNTLQTHLSMYTQIPAQMGLQQTSPQPQLQGQEQGQGQAEHPEELACELLDALNSLPIECVAINGPSLVQKVRFVGIQLMEASPDPSSTSRAQKLLMQLLSVLSVIEGMYSFGRDISAE